MIPSRNVFLLFDDDRQVAEAFVVAAPSRRRTHGGPLRWQLPRAIKARKPEPIEIDRLDAEPVVVSVTILGRGMILLPTMGLRAHGRLANVTKSSGRLGIGSMSATGRPRASARVLRGRLALSGSIGLRGSAFSSEPDYGLAEILHLEQVEDFR